MVNAQSSWKVRVRVITQVRGLPAAASCQPLSHRARVVVIVVMVAVLGVRNLQAGFALCPFVIGRVGLNAERRARLKEVGHKAHLWRRGEEKEKGFLFCFFLNRRNREYKHVRDTEEVRAGAGNCDYICLDRFVHSC